MNSFFVAAALMIAVPLALAFFVIVLHDLWVLWTEGGKLSRLGVAVGVWLVVAGILLVAGVAKAVTA